MVQTSWLDMMIKRIKRFHPDAELEAWEGLTPDEAYHIKMCHDLPEPEITNAKKVYPKPKLSRQQRLIIEAFQSAPNGELANFQLNKICFRYGGRIHELRKMGYKIITLPREKDQDKGVVWYRMEL